MILKDYENFGRFIVFDKQLHQIDRYDPRQLQPEPPKINGYFSSDADRFVATFLNVNFNEICLLVENDLLLLNGTLSIVCSAPPPVYDVTVHAPKDVVLRWKNVSPDYFVPHEEYDELFAIDEEDFCFALFLKNLCQDAERRQSFVDFWK